MNRDEATDAFLRGDDLDGMDDARESEARCDCGTCADCDDSDPGCDR